MQELIVKRMFLTMWEIWPQYLMLEPMIFCRPSFKMHTFGLEHSRMKILPGLGVMELPGDTQPGMMASLTMEMAYRHMWLSMWTPLANGMMSTKIMRRVSFATIKVSLSYILYLEKLLKISLQGLFSIPLVAIPYCPM